MPGKSIAIYMPLAAGSLQDLAGTQGISKELCQHVLQEMLAALDHLACKQMSHRDVKPANILYRRHSDAPQPRYQFFLADFGLAARGRPEPGNVGIEGFTAPEVRNGEPHGTKADVWSLYVTLVKSYKPNWVPSGGDEEIISAEHFPDLRFMTRRDPRYRASAAQCLEMLFDGEGLTTPPPIDALAEAPLRSRELAALRRGAEVATHSNILYDPMPQGSGPLTRSRRQAARALTSQSRNGDVIMGGTEEVSQACRRVQGRQ